MTIFQIYLYTFGGVFLVSLLSFMGVFFLFLSNEKLNKLIMLMVSFSAGIMLGDAAIHLMPEMTILTENSLTGWYWFLIGMLIFFVLEKIVHWHHCHNTEECEHEHTLGIMNLAGEGLHNFIDGAVLAGAFLTNFQLGITTLIAIVAHEIPHEIGNFGVLLHSGFSRGKALLYNFLSALLAFLGAFATFFLYNRIDNLSNYLLPLTAGGFIYIATGDLLPELKKDTALSKSLLQLVFIIIGVGVMALLKQFS
jgi:zinc and cadmium transporter